MRHDPDVDELRALLRRDDAVGTTVARFLEEARLQADERGAQPRTPSRLDEIVLRAPTPEDEDAFLAASRASTDLHAGWVSPPTDHEGYEGYLHRFAPDNQHSFLVWWHDRLAGVVNLQDVIRGNYQGTTLGYYAFADGHGHGVMRAAVALATDHAFDVLQLHRVEAGIQPTNERSVELVRSLGLRLEAYLPRLVRVDGAWRDHELWAVTSETWPGARRALAGAGGADPG